MQFSTHLNIYAGWCLFRGAGFIFSPLKLWKAFNVNLDKHTAFPVQIPGAAFIATALMNWTANILWEILLSKALSFSTLPMSIGALIKIHGISRHAVRKPAWLPFIFHLLFSIGFGYFLFSK